MKKCRDSVKYCNIGGQAVMEGVMMKGKSSMATAVRRPDGHIDLETKSIKPSPAMQKIYKIPVLRGSVNLVATMVEGVKVLLHSAELSGDESTQEEYEPSKFERWLSEKLHVKVMDVVAVVSVTLSLVLFVALFILLPSF